MCNVCHPVLDVINAVYNVYSAPSHVLCTNPTVDVHRCPSINICVLFIEKNVIVQYVPNTTLVAL